jgi:hypothetical protein
MPPKARRNPPKFPSYPQPARYYLATQRQHERRVSGPHRARYNPHMATTPDSRQIEQLTRELRELRNQLRRPSLRSGVTGWREVRGTHGIDYVADPNGTAVPPWLSGSRY